MELKDYLHLYLGCEVKCPKLSGWIYSQKKTVLTLSFFADHQEKDFKLILRPLNDMTEEERKKSNIWSLNPTVYPSHPTGFYSPMEFIYLLSKHFDLFQLIENGLAIDSTTLKEEIKSL